MTENNSVNPPDSCEFKGQCDEVCRRAQLIAAKRIGVENLTEDKGSLNEEINSARCTHRQVMEQIEIAKAVLES